MQELFPTIIHQQSDVLPAMQTLASGKTLRIPIAFPLPRVPFVYRVDAACDDKFHLVRRLTNEEIAVQQRHEVVMARRLGWIQ